jgi:hypothetical protein
MHYGAIVAAVGVACLGEMTVNADMILMNGKVITPTPEGGLHTSHTAVAVDDAGIAC